MPKTQQRAARATIVSKRGVDIKPVAASGNLFKKSAKYLIVLVLAIAFFMRFDYVSHYKFPQIKNDQYNYTVMAAQIIEDGVYGYKSEAPNAKVPPGWPLFLVGVFKVFGYGDMLHTLYVIRIFNCLFMTGTIYFLYRIGCRLFNRAAGLIAAGIATVYGPYLFVTGLILTENLFLLLFLAAVYYQVKIIQENKPRDHIIAGALAALATLVRPNTIIITVVPYLFLWIKHKKLFLKQIAFGAAAFAVCMLPWWIRNLITLDKFILLSQGSGNPFLAGTEPYFKKSIPWNDIDYDHQTEIGLERIKQGLKDDPNTWIRWFTTGKTKAMFLRGIYAANYFDYLTWKPWETVLRKLHKFLVYYGMPLAAIMPFIRRPYRFLAVHFFLFLFVQLLFIPETRYTLGMMPFLMLIVAGVITDLVGLGRKWIAGRRAAQPVQSA
ncbi:glycosyltransferase family 39 protein [Gorillibacterium sp. sgz500922]|uniref:glycosyltransferase family 39 protein n=1 Tax=Gorillibacterium sp. sgz500922 TaxID=3446694 RepID=UPI003F681CCA